MTPRRAVPAPEPGGRRGFALLIVLWTLVLLALLVTHLTATGRSEARIAGNYTSNAVAEATADAALNETIFHLMEGSWAADDTPHTLTEPDGEAVVRVENEAGKISPNVANPDLLSALMRVLGVDPGRAEGLAEAIVDWREPGPQPRPNGAKLPQYRNAGLDYGPPGTPFETIDEIGRVLGMTPDVLALLRPHLSVYQLGQPDPRFADKAVIQTMRQLPNQFPPNQNPAAQQNALPSLQTVIVTVEAKTKSDAYFVRRATLRVGPGFPRGYQVLTWDAPGRAPPAQRKPAADGDG